MYFFFFGGGGGGGDDKGVRVREYDTRANEQIFQT